MKYFIPLLLVLLCFSCAEDSQHSEASNSKMVVVPNSRTNIMFSNDLKETKALNIVEYLYYYNGGGVGIGDFDGDGLEDVFLTGNQVQDRLYKNIGQLQFEDVTFQSGIEANEVWSTGVNVEDINADGHLDIYISKVGLFDESPSHHNLVYINNGDGTFEEKSEEYGLDFQGFSTQTLFLDYDKDGDLDMYLLNHAIHTVRSYGKAEKRKEKDPYSGDRFYENRLNEEGKFVEVTDQAGIYSSPLGYGLAIAACDANQDGWTDIYVGNDFHENDYLYINNQNGTFTESAANAFEYTSQFSMGVDVADLNGDGWEDIFTTDMMPYDAEVALQSGGEDTDQIKKIKQDLGFDPQNARNHFQLNNKNGTYSDAAYISQTYATDWSWSPLIQDFNGDGSNDIFITNGIVNRPNDLDYINYINEVDKNTEYTEYIAKMPSQPLKNILFTNEGKLQYSDIKSSEIGTPTFSNGAAYADLDQDGDLDLVINNINHVAQIIENKTSENSNYIELILANKSKATVNGSVVNVYSKNLKWSKSMYTTRGFQSSSTQRLFFGLGAVSEIDSIQIIWPDLNVQTIINPEANQTLSIDKNNQEDSRKYVSNIIENQNANILPFKHEENNYIDENSEKLIPERLSHEGPAAIAEDLNGDNIIDLYLGGARGQTAILLFGNKNGSYTQQDIKDFEKDNQYEDVDAATIDFDNDGDLDLYVVSGGNDHKELDKLLEDRLYLNNGNGSFKRIPLSLPHTNGSSVSVADFDDDGFQDLFVGAHSIPGSYGLSPYSFILKNLQGQGVDIAYKHRFGMVSEGQWVDLDNDQDQDLVICGDWMNIRVLINNNGELEEKTDSLGLGNTQGLWNSIEITDINQDGKLDIIAGNAGTNMKWTASTKNPMKLSIGDYDQNGSSDPLIFYYSFGRYVPFASLDKLLSQLPILKKKFSTYDKFKTVSSVHDLIDEAEKKTIETKIVSTLASTIFINEEGKYKSYPMSGEHQLSPINDIYSENENLYYVGNNAQTVAALGPALSNSGRRLIEFNSETKTFLKSEALPIPNGINGRKIVSLNNEILIVSNNDFPYTIKQPNK